MRTSVVITCYDQAGVIGEAIASTLAQDHPVDEVIVVDDGSPTDDAAAVVGRYGGVRYIRQPNGGVGSARQRGLDLATGDVVIFVDGDDRLLPQATSVAVDALTADPRLGMVSGHCVLIDADGTPLRPSVHPCVEDDHYAGLLAHAWIHPPATVAFRRDALQHAGPWAGPELAMVEDLDMYLRVARRYPIRCHHEVVVEYRQHASNMSKQLAALLCQVLDRLDAERAIVADDPRLVAACDAGSRYWQGLMGVWLLDQVKQQARSPRLWPHAVRGAYVLGRRAPRMVTARAARKVRRMITREAS